MDFWENLGGRISKQTAKIEARLTYFRENHFVNLHPDKIMYVVGEEKISVLDRLSMMVFSNGSFRSPRGILPAMMPSYAPVAGLGDDVEITWFGHSTVLLRTKELTILTDPILGVKRTGPSPKWLGGVAFQMKPELSVANLPEKIDVVLISHSHYDHLDMPTIEKLHERVGTFIAPIGVSDVLINWDVPVEKVVGLIWYQETMVGDVKFVLTPTHHNSRRSLFDGDKHLWGSFVIEMATHKLFFSGDSGYTSEFARIGEKFGPFDLALMECGQYSKTYSVHMMPEDSVQACFDLKVKKALPIHWAKFALDFHPWREPIWRFVAKATIEELDYVSPKIGETIRLAEDYDQEPWWDTYTPVRKEQRKR